MADDTGRPTKFDKGRVSIILSHIRGGTTRTAAAAVAGIDRTTLWDWEKHDPPLVLDWDVELPNLTDPMAEDDVYEKGTTFPNALARAEEEAEAFLLSRIRKAGTESAKVTYIYDRNGNILREVHEYDWKAAAWIAERNPKLRQRWAQRQQLEISGPDGGPMETKSAVAFEPTPEYLAMLGKRVKEREALYGPDRESQEDGDEPEA
jgi:hypothetical protein